jgi:hypothetical protein
MTFSLSVLGGLLLAGFAFFGLKAARKGSKQDIPKLFPQSAEGGGPSGRK